MNTTMADGASERLDAQIADALFGQPGMSKLDVANRLRERRGNGGALLGSSVYPAAWMWPHPEDGSVRFTADGDVASEAASMGRAVSALYRVPVQEGTQPSPAGQAVALDSEQLKKLVSRILSTVSLGHQTGPYAYAGEDFGGYLREAVGDCRTIMQTLDDVAARQPAGAAVKDSLTVGGGEAVAWMTHHDEPMVYPTFSEAGAYCYDDEPPIPLYLAPPAQAVDLGDFKALYRAYVRLLECGRDRIIDLGGTCDPVDVMEANDINLQAARRVIDSKAVGNG